MTPNDFQSPPIRRIVTLVLVGIVALMLLGLTFSAWRSIRPGYVGIVFDKANHNVTTGALDPGWAFINPFSQAIQEYPVTIQTYQMVQSSSEGQRRGDDSIKIQSKDGVVRQYTRSEVPLVAAKFGWEEITSTKRTDVVTEITEILRHEFDRRHLSLISFGIREVHLPQSLQEALNQKIQAQQAAEQQKYQLAQAKVKAEQDVAQATGLANAAKARAEGEAQATLTNARAQAEANDLLAKSVTAPLIQYQLIQRWDGKLPLLTGAGGTPLIDVSHLTAPPQPTPGR